MSVNQRQPLQWGVQRGLTQSRQTEPDGSEGGGGSGEGGGAWDLQLSQKAVRVNSTRWPVAPVWRVFAATVRIKHFLQRPLCEK